ncbi:hypothetical protein PVAP13_9NG222773 [Panicum virgatum]|uniref:Uncharacterized protein n=1 Tax=Panicum virgatum TaxID=38727 RepID=A0A8T0ML41_PANVG|nr:hypothetical protein PVAP13_9NG222773 [Panicum virgatum]
MSCCRRCRPARGNIRTPSQAGLSSSPEYSHRGRLGGVWRSGAQLWPTWAQWSPQRSKENAQYSPVEFQPIMRRSTFAIRPSLVFWMASILRFGPRSAGSPPFLLGVSCFVPWEK